MDSLLESPLSLNGHVYEPTRNLPQYLAAGSANLILMIAGTVLGWTSPVLPKLTDQNATLHITETESSWIASLAALGSVIGPFPAGLCADWIGRKRALLAIAIPFLASWCILAAATNVTYIYIGRLISGFSSGWGMTVLPMYIGEIATPAARGALGVLGQILMTLGFLYVYSIGPYVPYSWVSIACAVIPVLFFASYIWMPESPYYFIANEDQNSATASLEKLRGKSSVGVKEEIQEIKNAVEESLKHRGSWADLIRVRANFKATYLMCGLMALQQFSGINVVLFYSESIFEKAGGTLSPSLSTIVVGFVMFVASLGGPYLIERLGRRIVLIVSALGMMTAQIALGAFFFAESHGVDTSKLGWVPLTSIIFYISLFSFGLGPVPWAMIGEMFSPSIRSKGAAITASFSWFLAFLMTNVFNEVVSLLGTETAFWSFAASCAVGALFVYVCLPETKGLTLQEIQNSLNQRRIKN